MSQKVKFTEVVNKVPWKGNDFPYSQPEFSLWKKATSALSTDTHTHTHTHFPHTHTHFPGRPDGFPNISSPSPPDLGVQGTSRGPVGSSKAIGDAGLSWGRVATDSGVEVRSAGNPQPGQPPEV
jgi:hypothetical protein